MKFKLIRCLATHFSFVEKKEFVLINPKAYTQRDNLALCKWKDDGWTPSISVWFQYLKLF